MISKCKTCDHEIGEAETMPSIIYFGCGAFIASIILVLITSFIKTTWIYILSFILLIFPLWLGASLLIRHLPLTFQWFINLFRKCPKCKNRKWTYPRYSGFGL